MSRRFWTKDEIKLLKYAYEDTPTSELAELLECKASRVSAMANKLGLRKSPELLASMARERTSNPAHASRVFRFKPGHKPVNKGTKRPGWAPGRMRETQFKKGQRPRTWMPIGSTRINAYGYLDLKISDTGYPPRDWVGAHILLWEDKHGPVPEKHAVAFKDGDKTNVRLRNLECISRRELMARNTIHNLPPQLVEVIMLNGALKRKLRRLDHGTKQDERPA